MLVVVEVVLLALLLQKVQVEPAVVVMKDLLRVDKDLQAQQTLAAVQAAPQILVSAFRLGPAKAAAQASSSLAT